MVSYLYKNNWNFCYISIEAPFEIEDYTTTCYLYECVAPLKALMLQKTAPSKFRKVIFKCAKMLMDLSTFILFKLVGLMTNGLRVDIDQETHGLDISNHEERGYEL